MFSRNNSAAPFNTAPLSDAGPLNLSITSSVSSDYLAVHNITSSSYGGPIIEDDIVIAVMGLIGAGKSTFVKKASGSDNVAIGSDLKPRTEAIHNIRCSHPDGRQNIVLVDTPGLDNTYFSDSHILIITANWLKNTYQNNIKLSGILYLHRISDVRFTGSPLRNLNVFREVCGQENLKNVILVTTMWDEIDDIVDFKREDELFSTLWNDMMSFGSQTCRFQGTYDSAWEILNLFNLEGNHESAPLQIQRELVDQSLLLHETSAGKASLRYLGQLIEDHQKVWGKMRNKTRPRATSICATGGHRYSTETVSSNCNTTSRRDILLVAITSLGFAYQVADITQLSTLKGTIGTVLHIARLIKGMGGTHHAISQVVENSAWLLEEITQHVAVAPLSGAMKETLRAFCKELSNLQKVMKKIQESGPVSRFLLHDEDIQAISACTTSIKAIYDTDTLEVKLAAGNRQAVVRLEDQIIALHNNPSLRTCECGMLVIGDD